MITLKDFFMGRDIKYADILTSDITKNAENTVSRANRLLDRFYAAKPLAQKRVVNSGWRPPAINATTAGAATKSNHLVGLAVDLSDPDGELDQWLMTPIGLSTLSELGLWLEHPESTPGWAHVQTVPPKSGNRVFKVK